MVHQQISAELPHPVLAALGRTPISNAEFQRLVQDATRDRNWKRWGPYLSERQWGTVREDYSPDGSCWDSFSHDQARSRAYRWGEDGLLGITDRECRLCFALALWNGKDPILKERLFGLTGPEGNHGEDVKEQYFYIDSTPTHSYMKGLYKYPQAEFPYAKLVEENRRRGRDVGEYELADTGVFDRSRYFDVFAEYAKAGPDDILIVVTVCNRGDAAAQVHVLPTVWFRNTWTWGCTHEGCGLKPRIERRGPGKGTSGTDELVLTHETLKEFAFAADTASDGVKPEWLFTENETNFKRLWNSENPGKYVKDAFHRRVVNGDLGAVNPEQRGTKAAAWYTLRIPAGGEVSIRLRLTGAHEKSDMGNDGGGGRGGVGGRGGTRFGRGFDATVRQRKLEADEFYNSRLPEDIPPAEREVARQAYAGMLWSKQFYHYVVEDWMRGDPAMPAPPAQRKHGRNHDWPHLFNRDVVSMPDKWEYPWYAAWDLAFHMLAFAKIDPEFAKDQLLLLLREWYMHPNGQIPAYEFAFGDVNPPVHAWACWRVYKLTGPRGSRDRLFLARAFQKLMLNFTWWVNRKDPSGNHIFSGGFLGLDNIGVFDRSRPLPTGGHLEQADGTAWMAFYTATMLAMSLELATEDPEYEDIASKFFEHFVAIADAMNTLGGTGLWDDEDGFYYDQLRVGGQSTRLRTRSMVGLVPLLTVEVLEQEVIDRLPGFKKRLEWFLNYRKDLSANIAYLQVDTQRQPSAGAGKGEGEGKGGASPHRLLAIPSRARLERVLRYMFDESEFFSPFGVRSLSRVHKDAPYVFFDGTTEHRVEYVPGESNTAIFGGNSNWRGPIWYPLNFLLVEALERYHYFYGDTMKIECPVGSGKMLTLAQCAAELRSRLCGLFLPDSNGRRPCHGDDQRFASDPHWRDLILFHEYFHGDSGLGLGASHQTGWTGLVAVLLHHLHERRATFGKTVRAETPNRARGLDGTGASNTKGAKAGSQKR